MSLLFGKVGNVGVDSFFEDAIVADLSQETIEKARSVFIQRNAQHLFADEVREWSDEKFLVHVGLLTKRGLIRAAILLLGNPESSYLLNPLMAELTWRLVGQEGAYEHLYKGPCSSRTPLWVWSCRQDNIVWGRLNSLWRRSLLGRMAT